jgi:hypothetical protein
MIRIIREEEPSKLSAKRHGLVRSLVEGSSGQPPNGGVVGGCRLSEEHRRRVVPESECQGTLANCKRCFFRRETSAVTPYSPDFMHGIATSSI